MTATPPEEPHAPVLDKKSARQGRSGAPIVWVLAIGATLTAIALFAVWAFGAGQLASTEPHNARQASDAQLETDLRAPLQTAPADSPSPDDGRTTDEAPAPAERDPAPAG